MTGLVKEAGTENKAAIRSNYATLFSINENMMQETFPVIT